MKNTKKNKTFDPFKSIKVIVDPDNPTKNYMDVDDEYLATNIHWEPTPPEQIADWEPQTIADYDSLRILNVDIETEGLNPDTNRVVMIGMICNLNDSFKGKTKHLDKLKAGYIIQASRPNDDVAEAKMISKFQKIVRSLGTQVIPTHNGMEFDYKFIQRRIEILRRKPGIIRNRITLKDMFFISPNEKMISAASFYGRPITYHPVYTTPLNRAGYPNISDRDIQLIDTLHLATQVDKIAANMSSYSLKYLAHYVKFRTEKRLELKHTQIQNYWKSQDPEKLELLRHYLICDLEDQRAVTNFFLPAVWYQKMFVGLTLQDLAVSSPAKKWNTILQDYYRPFDRGTLPNGDEYSTPESDDKLKYEGALVDCLPGLYKNFFKIDVSSLYPSLILRYGLAGPKDPMKVSEVALKLFKDLRLVFKAAAGDDPKSILAMEAYASVASIFENVDLDNITSEDRAKFSSMDKSLKVCINGFYGFLGVGGYPYNSIKSAALTTAYGRVLMREMRAECEKWTNIINVDTDGLCLQPKLTSEVDTSLIDGYATDPVTGELIAPIARNETEEYINPKFVWAKVQALLPEGINVDIEDNYPDGAIYAPKMKNYVYWSHPDDKPKTKGVYRKRNRSLFQKQFPINYLWYVAFEDNEIANEYYQDSIRLIQSADTGNISSENLELFTFTQNIPSNNRTLVEFNVGQPRDKVSYVWCSLQEYTDKRGDPKKNKTKLPIKVTITEQDEYLFTPQELPEKFDPKDINLGLNTDFYKADIDKLKYEIDETVGLVNA